MKINGLQNISFSLMIALISMLYLSSNTNANENKRATVEDKKINRNSFIQQTISLALIESKLSSTDLNRMKLLRDLSASSNAKRRPIPSYALLGNRNSLPSTVQNGRYTPYKQLPTMERILEDETTPMDQWQK